MTYLTFHKSGKQTFPDQLNQNELLNTEVSPTSVIENCYYGCNSSMIPNFGVTRNDEFVINFETDSDVKHLGLGIIVLPVNNAVNYLTATFKSDNNSNLVCPDKLMSFIEQVNGFERFHLLTQVFAANLNKQHESYNGLPVFQCKVKTVIDGLPLLNYLLAILPDTFTSKEQEAAFKKVKERLLTIYLTYYTRNEYVRECLVGGGSNFVNKDCQLFAVMDRFLDINPTTEKLHNRLFTKSRKIEKVNKNDTVELLSFLNYFSTLNFKKIEQDSLEVQKRIVDKIISRIDTAPKSYVSLLRVEPHSDDYQTVLDEFIANTSPVIFVHFVNAILNMQEPGPKEALKTHIGFNLLENVTTAMKFCLTDLSAYPQVKEWVITQLKSWSGRNVSSKVLYNYHSNISSKAALFSTEIMVFKNIDSNKDIADCIHMPHKIINDFAEFSLSDTCQSVLELWPESMSEYFNGGWEGDLKSRIGNDNLSILSQEFASYCKLLSLQDILSMISRSTEPAKKVINAAVKGSFENVVNEDFILLTIKDLDSLLNVYEAPLMSLIDYAGNEKVKNRILKYMSA
ncbi:hypothetical protein L1267_16830 [Pseudoalteromonas sp. OFAV1]|uniref:hypothetical protein n=1 Tax=Pseudoalteromonas sp. OFAV1 TaxID=2908892 RepID=UPI001F33036F|nr:hypothetical protein [Pseudoalteromonas sp. OFAV1]MCF2902042.1 hypothetical protein [Pseudoalteromonas sp. OFAV1]